MVEILVMKQEDLADLEAEVTVVVEDINLVEVEDVQLVALLVAEEVCMVVEAAVEEMLAVAVLMVEAEEQQILNNFVLEVAVLMVAMVEIKIIMLKMA